MELKNVVAILAALCIISCIFIIVFEIYQSQSFSSNWNHPKSHLVASRYNAYHRAGSNEILSPTGVDIKIRRHGSWLENNDVRYKLEVAKNENDISVTKKWITTEMRGTTMEIQTNSISISTPGLDYKKPRMMRRQLMRKMKKDDGQLSEEEKLKISPYIYNEEEEKKRLSIPIVETEVKYISFFLPWELNQMKKRSFKACRYKKCAFVTDMSQADLVAFAANHLRDHPIPNFQRPQGQRWLMYTIDPAIRGFELGRSNIRSLFNDTFTYSLDSDIQFIFGRLRKLAQPPPKDYDRLYEGKTKMAAWFVSHCDTTSKREDYVKQMQTMLDVDIYGACGNLSCGEHPRGPHSRSQDGSVCLPLLTNKYKFYLAFENAYCLDYITEKFFKLFQDVQVIPVVRGGFQYKKYLPSGIFIDADDFESPDALAQYLIDLGNDKQRYIEMLRLKDEWTLVKPPARECLICEYLHSNPPNKFYPDLQDKFGRATCYYPKKGQGTI